MNTTLSDSTGAIIIHNYALLDASVLVYDLCRERRDIKASSGGIINEHLRHLFSRTHEFDVIKYTRCLISRDVAKGDELVTAGSDDLLLGRRQVRGRNQDIHGVDDRSVLGDQVGESAIAEVHLVDAYENGIAHFVVDFETRGGGHLDDRSASAVGLDCATIWYPHDTYELLT
jgi:hypothetical protein